jgi:hypothetical protein
VLGKTFFDFFKDISTLLTDIITNINPFRKARLKKMRQWKIAIYPFHNGSPAKKRQAGKWWVASI